MPWSKLLICTVTSLLFVFISCTGSTDSPLDYFPLEIGMKWEYHVVKSDIDTSRLSERIPIDFTVEVIDKHSINNIEYYAIENFYFPGPSIHDTSYMRIEDDRVFVIINNEEHLLYSFSPSDTNRWHVPMYVNQEDIYDYSSTRTNISDSKCEFLWYFGYNIGRAEAHWSDVFEDGIGRTKIISFSQAFGEVIWEGDIIN